METKRSVSEADFQRVLTPENIRIFQVIFAAIGSGVLLFAVVVIFLGMMSTAEAAAADLSLVRTLTFVHVLLLLMVIPAGRLLYARMLAQDGPPITANQCMTRIRTAEIVRLALLEGVALLGLVVCLIGGLNGVLAAHPLYWLNIISSIVLLAFVSQNLPNADRLNQTFRAHFG